MPGLFFAHTVHQTAERDPGRQPVEWRNGQLAAIQTAKDTLRAQSAALILEVGPSQPENADVAERDRRVRKVSNGDVVIGDVVMGDGAV